MGKNITDVVREICLGMPETSEVISRGGSNFRVADKTFANTLKDPILLAPALPLRCNPCLEFIGRGWEWRHP